MKMGDSSPEELGKPWGKEDKGLQKAVDEPLSTKPVFPEDHFQQQFFPTRRRTPPGRSIPREAGL